MTILYWKCNNPKCNHKTYGGDRKGTPYVSFRHESELSLDCPYCLKPCTAGVCPDDK